MKSDGGTEGLTLVFLGFADPGNMDRVAAYEDELLPLLDAHGGVVRFRGRRSNDDPNEPAEVHVLWFPDGDALNGYLADDRRLAVQARHGAVFDRTQVIEVR